MNIERTSIADVLIIRPRKFTDERGFFAPLFRQSDLERAGVAHGWVQENQSRSHRKGTVRGLHYQRPPFAQAKLVRVIRGAAMDVCVDLRPGSSTFGQHVSTELTSDNLVQVYIPAGFAHGFCTLNDDTEVVYKASAPWSEAHEAGILWNDPALAIVWPTSAGGVTINARDRVWPTIQAAVPAG